VGSAEGAESTPYETIVLTYRYYNYWENTTTSENKTLLEIKLIKVTDVIKSIKLSRILVSSFSYYIVDSQEVYTWALDPLRELISPNLVCSQEVLVGPLFRV
jgi:hypothetical protein